MRTQQNQRNRKNVVSNTVSERSIRKSRRKWNQNLPTADVILLSQHTEEVPNPAKHWCLRKDDET